nr:MAG TPA: hypothetical protein [Caudoviricetes sp.]
MCDTTDRIDDLVCCHGQVSLVKVKGKKVSKIRRID